MASASKGNSIREILNRGIFLSLVLSLLVGSGVVIVWQYVAQVRANEYNVRVVKEALQRDAADLLTSAMLKNYEAVGFQLKTALASLPLGCAYIELPGQRYAVKGDPGACATTLGSADGVYREQISSGGMTIGPLVYSLESHALPPGSAVSLILAFVALVGCVVMTWSVLIKMINDAILRPLGGLSTHLTDADYSTDSRTTCDEVVSLAQQLQSFRSQVSTSAKREEFVRVARMVAHNIDTPVLVLEGVDASKLDDKNRAIYRDALSDIKALVANLRSEAATIKQTEAAARDEQIQTPSSPISVSVKPAPALADAAERMASTAPLTVEHIAGLVELAVSEKTLQLRAPYQISFNPSPAAHGAFATVQRTELKCILLNLMNNAVDALHGVASTTRRVEVTVDTLDTQVVITIADDGPGVDPVVLSRLGERGFTSKKDGSGLGLYHAKTMAEAWGGSLRIDSHPGKGMRVTVTLPVAPPPDWFVDKIQLSAGQCVAVLDDDPLIGTVWGMRLEKAGLPRAALAAFTQAPEFKTWVRAKANADLLCLVDFELRGQDQNGLAIIEELGISERAILVTGRYDDPAVQKNVRWLGTRMIPKPLVAQVPIGVQEERGIALDGPPPTQ